MPSDAGFLPEGLLHRAYRVAQEDIVEPLCELGTREQVRNARHRLNHQSPRGRRNRFMPAEWHENMLFLHRVIAALAVAAFGLIAPRAFGAPTPVVSWQKQADGVTFQLRPGVMKLQVCAPRVIRVLYGPGTTLPSHHSLSVIEKFRPTPWHLTATAQTVTLTTGPVQAQVARATGAVRFLDAQGTPYLSETPGGRSMTPITLAGPTPVAAYRTAQSFVMPAGEDVYGLGQHQDGDMSYRGSVVTLEQTNREVAIPFLTSSRGYGLLWDDPAHTEVSAGAGGAETIPSASSCLTSDGKPGGLTAQYYQDQGLQTLVTTRTDPQVDFHWTTPPAPGLGQESFSVRWTGQVQAAGGRRIHLCDHQRRRRPPLD